jgi:transcriptional regulator with XRE-family HTH domain
MPDRRFARRLRELRRQRCLSLRQLGAAACCSYAYISQLEHGHREPTVEIAAALERALAAPAELVGLVPVALVVLGDGQRRPLGAGLLAGGADAGRFEVAAEAGGAVVAVVPGGVCGEVEDTTQRGLVGVERGRVGGFESDSDGHVFLTDSRC